MSHRESWVGSLFLGDGWAVYAGMVGPTTPHAHHAFQLARVLEGHLCLRGADDVEAYPCEVAAIAPSVPHAVEGPASRSVMAYVDPDTLVGRRLRVSVPARCLAREWQTAGDALRVGTTVTVPDGWPEARERVHAMTSALGANAARAHVVHPALVRARAWLVEHLHANEISLDRVAVASGVSGDRLSHLLNDELGIGLRPLILWLRLQVAAREIALSRGATMSRAAAAAGFADAAHMTRTFRRMFGVAPSEVVGLVRWVLPPG